jgi:hypothetical protein
VREQGPTSGVDSLKSKASGGWLSHFEGPTIRGTRGSSSRQALAPRGYLATQLTISSIDAKRLTFYLNSRERWQESRVKGCRECEGWDGGVGGRDFVVTVTSKLRKWLDHRGRGLPPPPRRPMSCARPSTSTLAPLAG